MVRISDARMSGTSYGACVLHVSPESFVGGPLALVRDGDLIELDVAGRARLVAQGTGQRGRCVDYIRNTLDHMRELGVHDPHLARILATALDLTTDKEPK